MPREIQLPEARQRHYEGAGGRGDFDLPRAERCANDDARVLARTPSSRICGVTWSPLARCPAARAAAATGTPATALARSAASNAPERRRGGGMRRDPDGQRVSRRSVSAPRASTGGSGFGARRAMGLGDRGRSPREHDARIVDNGARARRASWSSAARGVGPRCCTGGGLRPPERGGAGRRRRRRRAAAGRRRRREWRGRRTRRLRPTLPPRRALRLRSRRRVMAESARRLTLAPPDGTRPDGHVGHRDPVGS